MGSYSTILTTLHKHFIFLFRPFMNLLRDGFCSHGLIFHYSDHPSSTQRLWICSWTALRARGSYSTILTTLHKPITFLCKSFMNLLLDGFSSHGLIFHDSDHPSETFHLPIQTLYEFAPGRLLQPWTHIPLFRPPFINPALSYSNPLWICSWTALAAMGSYSTILTTLHKPVAFLFKSFMNLLLDGFNSHGLIFHYFNHPS